MKGKRVVAALLSWALLIMAPLGALAQEGAEPAYSVKAREVLAELDAAAPQGLPEIQEEEPEPYSGEDGLDGAEAAPEEGAPVVTENLQRSVDELGSGQPGLSQGASFDVTAPRTMEGSMYSQLTTRQKACYDALAGLSIDRIQSAASDSDGYKMLRMEIPGLTGLHMNGYVQNGYFVPTGSSAATEKAIYTDLLAAATAVRYDMPEKIWTHDMMFGYRTEGTSTSATVTQLCYYFNLLYDGQEKSMQGLMMQCAQIIADKVKEMPDRYQQVMLIHEVLAQMNSYNYPAADGTATGWDYHLSHSPYSALIPNDEYEPVCDGYAKAFKIVCDLADIPCALPSSNTHMWNNVLMDDLEWYNVDVTWDDGDDGKVYYDYFLVGSQTVIGGEAFSKQEDHVEANPYPSEKWANNVTLRFPTKNTKAYEYLGHDYPPLRFSDVKRSDWYYAAIEEAAELGLFGGSGGKFLPRNNISRAEFAKAITNLLQADLSAYTGSPFNDVPADKWYAAPISYVKALGVMSGSGGNFRPNDPITREEMCVTLYNLAKKQGLEASGSQSRFPDHASISSWARDAVYACRELGLVNGDGQGNFSPRGNTQRSAAATVFVRYYKVMETAPNPDPTPGSTPSPYAGPQA